MILGDKPVVAGCDARSRQVVKMQNGNGWHRLACGLPHFCPMFDAQALQNHPSDDGLDLSLKKWPKHIANEVFTRFICSNS